MIKVDFIIGFLGAGKTTLLQKLIPLFATHNERVVIVVNDFGKVNYDALTLNQQGIEIIEVSAGCLCCGLKMAFREILLNLSKRTDIQRILIEPSGIFIPDQAVELFKDDELKKNLILEPFITVVDAFKFHTLPIRNFPFIQKQISMGRHIILNRTEKLSQTDLLKVTKDIEIITPLAQIHQFDVTISFENLFYSNFNKSYIIDNMTDTPEPHPFTTTQIQENLDFQSTVDVQKFIANQGELLIRAKGIVSIKNAFYFLNFTKSELKLDPYESKTECGLTLIFENNGAI